MEISKHVLDQYINTPAAVLVDDGSNQWYRKTPSVLQHRGDCSAHEDMDVVNSPLQVADIEEGRGRVELGEDQALFGKDSATEMAASSAAAVVNSETIQMLLAPNR